MTSSKLGLVDLDEPLYAHARRDELEEEVHKLFDLRFDLLQPEIGPDESHAAVGHDQPFGSEVVFLVVNGEIVDIAFVGHLVD